MRWKHFTAQYVQKIVQVNIGISIAAAKTNATSVVFKNF